MRSITHYYFSTAVILIEGIFISQISVVEQIILLPLALLVSLVAIAPNVLDKYFCLDRKTRTCTERCRHPITHHPVNLLVLVIIFSSINIETSYYGLYFLLTKTFLLSYGSHLFLDMLSSEGIPIGTIPTLFCQDQTKNYRFNDLTKPRRQISIMNLSRDSFEINNRTGLTCKIIIGLYCFQLVYELWHDPSEIIFLGNILNEFTK